MYIIQSFENIQFWERGGEGTHAYHNYCPNLGHFTAHFYWVAVKWPSKYTVCSTFINTETKYYFVQKIEFLFSYFTE